MAEWGIEADDLHAATMIVELDPAAFRVALTDDFAGYQLLTSLDQLRELAR